MKKLPGIFCSLFVAVVVSATYAGAQSPVAYVVEKHGVWVLTGSSSDLTGGQKLPAGRSIRRKSSSSEDYITIADMQMKVIARRNCAEEDCSRAIILPRQPPSRSYVGSLWDAAMDKIFGSPYRNDDPNAARSGGLVEAVVEYRDGKASLNAVLTVEGEQYLRWRTKTFASSGDWSEAQRLGQDATVSDLKPGLYEINLMRSNGSNFEPIGLSWLLVASQTDYEKMAADFKEVRDIAEQWGEKVKPETRRLFLRASLEKLAEK